MWIENRNCYRKRQVVCAILGVCVSLLFTLAVCDRREVVAAKRLSSAQAEMADEVFRFHVLANSDSKEDQELKLMVRDEILSYMKEYISYSDKAYMNIRTSDVNKQSMQCQKKEVQIVKNWAENHLEDIEQVAYRVICAKGYDYSVKARVTECYFPDRRYGEVLFPKGYYEALRVEIGEAAGHNWWCVLYPSLCFTDATCAVVTDEGEQELAGVLSEESYETVTATSGNFKIKSFFYELFKGET